MTEGHIVRPTWTARVSAQAGDDGRAAGLAGTLLRTELPAALCEALDDAFADDPAVYIARSVHCSVGAGPASTADGLARSVAAQVARSLRASALDRADLVRFPTVADYHAAFLAAHVSGDARDRWYFGPLRHLAALPPPAAFQTLAAEGHDMGAVLLALRRSGALPRVLTAAGEQALARSWPAATSARASQHEWLSLARLALDLASALGWPVNRGEAGPAQAGPARSGPPDLNAVAATLADQARQDGQDLDWTDPVALAAALARATWLLASPGSAASQVTASQLPPWVDWADTRTLLTVLAAPPQPPFPPGAALSPLRPRESAVRPPRTTAIEALLADLIARKAVALDPRRPVTSAVSLWAAVTDRMPALAQATWPRDLVIGYVKRELAAAGSQAGPAHHGPRAAAGQVRPFPPRLAAVSSACAGLYLLLRSLDAIRMPRLCEQSGIPPSALLYRLARRWCGPAVSPADTAAVLRPVTGDLGAQQPVPAAAWQRLMSQAVAAAHAQCPGDRGDPPPEDALAVMTHAHDADADTDLALDLISFAVLRHWAWWLRGFADATAGYLLDAFVRRPGLLTPAAEGTLIVTLHSRPHDAALAASGALAAVDLTWPWPPARERVQPAAGRIRRVEFTTVP